MMKAQLREGLLEPAQDFVLVEIFEGGQTPGGVVLPQGAQVGLPRGRVIAVGPGSWQYGVFVKTKLKPGDLVLLQAKIDLDGQSPPLFNGWPVEIGGKPCALFRENTILGVIRQPGSNGQAP